jgi:hypothetical protein
MMRQQQARTVSPGLFVAHDAAAAGKKRASQDIRDLPVAFIMLPVCSSLLSTGSI